MGKFLPNVNGHIMLKVPHFRARRLHERTVDFNLTRILVDIHVIVVLFVLRLLKEEYNTGER